MNDLGSTKFCGLARLVRRCGVAAMMALAGTTTLAQEAAAPADYEDGSAVQPAVPAQAEPLEFYQVRATTTDYMPGRLRVASPITGEITAVRKTGLLLVQRGKIVARAESGVGGVAQIPALPPGVYSVVAIGPDGISAFGVQLLPPLEGGGNGPTYLFDVLLVPPADYAVAQRTLVGGVAVAAPGAPVPPAPLPPVPVSQKKEAVSAVKPAAVYVADEVAVDDSSAPIKGEIVTVGPRERMVGRLVALDPATGLPTPFNDARVAFLRGGQLLGVVETDSDGYFGATGIENGVYSMVGVGPKGVIAHGAQVATVNGVPTADVDGNLVPTTFVTLQQGAPSPDMQSSAARPDAMPFVPGFGGQGPFPPPGFGPPAPGPGAGFGGGGGGGAGGGGFGGGGGLLGALLGAGLGAGIGAAIASDSDDDGGGAVVSPANPPE